MQVTILREAGLEEALLGLSLSHNAPLDRMPAVADELAHRYGGHNKFLESIVVWLDITAPRYFWQQFDTYRVGITKQSESTMHTLLDSPLVADDFEGYIPQDILDHLNEQICERNFESVKHWLPESFLQRRVVCTNYKALRHIVGQRGGHKLQEWHVFVSAMDGLQYPEWVLL